MLGLVQPNTGFERQHPQVPDTTLTYKIIQEKVNMFQVAQVLPLPTSNR